MVCCLELSAFRACRASCVASGPANLAWDGGEPCEPKPLTLLAGTTHQMEGFGNQRKEIFGTRHA